MAVTNRMKNRLFLRGGANNFDDDDTDEKSANSGKGARNVQDLKAELAKAMALLEKAKAGFAAAGGAQKCADVEGLHQALRTNEHLLSAQDERGKVAVRLAAQAAAAKLKGPYGDGAIDFESQASDDQDWDRDLARDKRSERIMKDSILRRERQHPGADAGGGGAPSASIFDSWPALTRKTVLLTHDPHYPLWKAVTDNNTDRLAYLLLGASGHDPNYRFPSLWNSTLLHVACESGAVPAITALIAAGADPDAANSLEQQPAHLAAYWGNGDALERLVDMGAAVECRSHDASTPLHVAAFRGRADAARRLVLGLGASLTSVNRHGQAAAALAAAGGFDDLAEWLRGAARNASAAAAAAAAAARNATAAAAVSSDSHGAAVLASPAVTAGGGGGNASASCSAGGRTEGPTRTAVQQEEDDADARAARRFAELKRAAVDRLAAEYERSLLADGGTIPGAGPRSLSPAARARVRAAVEEAAEDAARCAMRRESLEA